MKGRSRLIVSLLALVFLAAHLRDLPKSLEDIDSVNFALGVESFDVTRHQPHPPGYPVFILLAKASTSAVGIAAPGWDRDRRAAVGLALWGVLAGAAAAFCLFSFWTAVGLPPVVGLSAAALTMFSPLFWITAARPLTDISGLVAALVVQTWFLLGWRTAREDGSRLPTVWVLAAIGVGLLPGLRSQAVLLTGPLACWALGELIWRRRWSHAAWFFAFAVAGALVWAVPLVWLSGGTGAYIRALGAQGAEDFVGVEMLATTPTFPLLAETLRRTFIVPWSIPLLGQVMALLSLLGVARIARRDPRVLVTLAVAFVPYLVFHLAFQETATTRYAVPLMVPMGGLAVYGLFGLGHRAGTAGAVAAVAVSLSVAQPLLRAYGAEAAPTSAVVRDMIAARAPAGATPVVQTHHQTWWAERRTLEWYKPQWDIGSQPFPGDREWLQIVDHFRSGRQEPVWLLADRTRSDTVLFDRRSRLLRGSYERSVELQRLVGGDRLEAAAWWEVDLPGWMLGRGWALSPEVAGATAEDSRQPHRHPAEGWLRRTADPRRLMIGGRYLGGSGDAVLVLALDGREIARWTVAPSPAWFVRWLDLPAGVLAGEGAYSALTARVEAVPGAGTPPPELGLEQFDFAPVDALMYAFTDGWQELEEDPSSGTSWRWSSENNTVVVHGGARDLRVHLAGESPRLYFDGPVTVRVSVAGLEQGRFTAAADFDEVIRIPRSALVSMPAEISITSDRVFVPAELGDSPDRRRLALRLYHAEIQSP